MLALSVSKLIEAPTPKAVLSDDRSTAGLKAPTPIEPLRNEQILSVLELPGASQAYTLL